MKKDFKYLKVLYPIESNTNGINLKETDINSLSMLLFTDASYEYITSNLLSKRKFNMLNKLGVLENVSLRYNKTTYMVSSIYKNQIRNIFVKYYGTKYKK